ncbi:hypothetical protein EAH87_11125 [Sphingomonas koreensis]|nr:hypothetical protein EAH87_11125 [Sphingomonas koreensis]
MRPTGQQLPRNGPSRHRQILAQICPRRLVPERAPDALLADKGYDADAIRADLAKRNIEAVIPGRSNRRVKIEHDRALYKQRNRIERMFGQLKINRAIATRYDQLANSFLGMVHLATARYWLKFVHAA